MLKEYEEFRIYVTTNPADGQWTVDLHKCPIPGEVGPKGLGKPVITRQQLSDLRKHMGWPNLDLLKKIGQAVWQSVMTSDLKSAFNSCLLRSNTQGLHVTFILHDEGEPPNDASAIRLAELPVETLYDDDYGFIATLISTSISRSLQLEPDIEPAQVMLPLRILVVVSAPRDKPPVQAEDEIRALQCALAPLIEEGKVVLEFCDPPTKNELRLRLTRPDRPCHVLHFIGHGGFGNILPDPTPQGYLALTRPDDSNLSSPLYAHDFAMFLRSSAVRLVVLTACSTAEEASQDELDAAGALSSVVQRLMAGISTVAAAIAMQFDLESIAAAEFTGELYKHLFDANGHLDEAVTRARLAIITKLGQGHHAWIAPTVYHRGKCGAIFTYRWPPKGMVAQLEEFFKNVCQIPIQEVQNCLVAAKESLEYNCQQMKLLKEYKEAHDYLQRLDDLHRILYAKVYDQNGDLKPDAQLVWGSIKEDCDSLRHEVERLDRFMLSTHFSAEETEWLESLRQSSKKLGKACDFLNSELLDLVVYEISRVIGKQTSTINGLLIGKSHNLELPGLLERLNNLHKVARDNRQRALIGEFEYVTDAIAELRDMSECLTRVSKEHDFMQHIDDSLRSEAEQLPASADGMGRFRRNWERVDRTDMYELCRLGQKFIFNTPVTPQPELTQELILDTLLRDLVDHGIMLHSSSELATITTLTEGNAWQIEVDKEPIYVAIKENATLHLYELADWVRGPLAMMKIVDNTLAKEKPSPSEIRDAFHDYRRAVTSGFVKLNAFLKALCGDQIEKLAIR